MVFSFCMVGFPYKGVLDDISEGNNDFPFSATWGKQRKKYILEGHERSSLMQVKYCIWIYYKSTKIEILILLESII